MGVRGAAADRVLAVSRRESTSVRVRADAATMTSIAAAAAHSATPGIAARPLLHRHLYSRLQRDWTRLCHSDRHLARVRSWQLPVGPVQSLDELLRHTGYGRPRDVRPDGDRDGALGAQDAREDDVLLVLVALAHTDELAARIVLQRILPGLWALTRRRTMLDRAYGRFDGNARDHDDEVLATAWTVIRCFRVDRRQDHIAARMLKEIEYRAFRLPHRRQATFVPTPLPALDRPVEDDGFDDPAVLLDAVLAGAARRGLAADDLDLLRRWGAGEAAGDLAAVLRVTERTVRNHRAAALRRLQELVSADAEPVSGRTDGQGASRMTSSISHTR